MEEEVLQTVLSEVLEELKEVKQQQGEAVKILVGLSDKVRAIEAEISVVKKGTSNRHLGFIVGAMNTVVDQIKRVVEAQPKSITRQFRILLFPEFGASEYYKIVGKIFIWLFALVVLTYVFVLGNNFISAYLKAKQSENEANKYRKAWIFLYHNSKRSVRQKMDSVWSKSW